MTRTVTAECAADPKPLGHAWHAIYGKYLHWSGYHLPSPDSPDPNWTYYCCSRCGQVLSSESELPAPSSKKGRAA